MSNLPEYNTGLISDFSFSLWVGGSIPYEVVNPSGDWRKWAVVHEKQKDPVETMACVSFSCNNCLEIQYKFFGIDVNFSDRALAKMSGTQMNGNTLERVNDTARNIGLLLESQWPNNPKAKTWEEYYAQIPIETQKLAVKQPFNYEWVARTNDFTEQIKKQLKQSPLQITVFAPNPNHAVVLHYIEDNNIWAWRQDHYGQQLVRFKVSEIAAALKPVLNKNQMNEYVKTINLDGEIAGYVPLRNQDDIDLFNKIFNKNLIVNSDGTINTDIMAKRL